MLIWRIIPAILMLPVWVCVYVCVRRGVRLFGARRGEHFVQVISFLLSTAIMLPAINIWGSTKVWTIVVLHLCAFALVVQLIRFVVRRARHRPLPRHWERLYQLTVIPVLCTGLIFACGWHNLRNVVETGYTISTGKTVAGYRAALVADVHYGTSTDRASIQAVADRIAARQVDLVLLCGDIVDESTTLSEAREVFRIFGQIESTYGTYFVYGNHDPAPYTGQPNYTDEELAAALEDGGVTALVDQTVQITDDLVLAGRQDRSTSRLAVSSLLQGVDREDFILLMDHQPDEFAEKAEAGVDLQVSGHTHNGQIFPIGWLTRLLHVDDLVYGSETVDGMAAVVTSGLSGWGYPIRTQGHSEYVILDIR